MEWLCGDDDLSIYLERAWICVNDDWWIKNEFYGGDVMVSSYHGISWVLRVEYNVFLASINKTLKLPSLI